MQEYTEKMQKICMYYMIFRKYACIWAVAATTVNVTATVSDSWYNNSLICMAPGPGPAPGQPEVTCTMSATQ